MSASKLPDHEWDDAEHRAAIHQAFDQLNYLCEFGPRGNIKWHVRKLARLCENAEVRRAKRTQADRHWPGFPRRRATMPFCFDVA